MRYEGLDEVQALGRKHAKLVGALNQTTQHWQYRKSHPVPVAWSADHC